MAIGILLQCIGWNGFENQTSANARILQAQAIGPRVDIWRDQCDQRSCKIKILVSCENFHKTSQTA